MVGLPSTAAAGGIYLIDAGESVSPDFDTFAITANGYGDWLLGVRGGSNPHTFSGTLLASGGFYYANLYNAGVNDTFEFLDSETVSFSFVAPENEDRTIIFGTWGATTPITFNLFIDGNSAVNNNVLFSSGNAPATTLEMPFTLTTFDQGAGGGPEVPEPATLAIAAPALLACFMLGRRGRFTTKPRAGNRMSTAPPEGAYSRCS